MHVNIQQYVTCFFREFTAKATEYGKAHENLARKKYEEVLGVKVKPTGLSLLQDHHYIAASADGIVYPCLIEIKCPYTGADKTIQELVDSGYSHIYRNETGPWQLKKTSHYYFQVQGGMAIKNCSMCHFVVWTMRDMVVITVDFDAQFWNNVLLPSLKRYFLNVVKPRLIAG